MCRLLMLFNANGVNPNSHLKSFRKVSQNSTEFQGHGWGCSWLDSSNHWHCYHNISPVWEDLKSDFPRARVFLAHARSAFRDEGIAVENNMPFADDHRVFIFNGELQGVRIKAEGRIGAEKIFNTIKRLDHGNLAHAVERGVMVLNKRTRYIRALNFFLADAKEIHLCSLFNESPEYFQMCESHSEGTTIMCSQPYPDLGLTWTPIPNNTLRSIPISSDSTL